jgi:diphthamide biosynthesis protein 4
MPDETGLTEPTYYKILGLSGRPSSTLSKQDVKAAYHRSLLQYHPDKINASLSTARLPPWPHERLYTIDQITEAYNILASPITRAAYDKELELSAAGTNGKYTKETFHTGVEVHDLEDLDYDEDRNAWSQGCRCGDPQGYILTEAELERESSEAEVYVACKGCSLWIKVLFFRTESDREMEEEETQQQKQQQDGTKLSV